MWYPLRENDISGSIPSRIKIRGIIETVMKAKLVKKTTEAKNTVSFYFEPEKQTSFLPGQYYYFTLPKLNYPDPRGNTRHFTIASSPTESKIFQITTRIREESGYKKTLDDLQIGSEIEIEGPNGTFVLDEKSGIANNIFLAGGIGITPFRSIIKYNIDQKSKNSMVKPSYMHLIYSNGGSDFVFKKELKKWSRDHDFIKVDFFDTSKSEHLDSKSLSHLVSNHLVSSTYWVVGPPAFVSAMEEILRSLKIPSSNIFTEKFIGY